MSIILSRRSIFKLAAGAAALSIQNSRWVVWASTVPAPKLSPLFSRAEWNSLGLLVDEILPKTSSSPSATDAGVLTFIDRMLMGKLPRWIIHRKTGKKLPPWKSIYLPYYKKSLMRLDAASKTTFSRDFVALDAAQRQMIVHDFAASIKTQVGYKIVGNPKIEDATDSDLFAMIRTHAIQGFFSEPEYGGNGNYIAWESIGHTCQFNYPKMDAKCPPHEM